MVVAAALQLQLAFRHEALQVRHEPETKRILDIHSLHRDQITRHFRGTLAEAHDVIVDGETLRIKGHSIGATWRDLMEEKEKKTEISREFRLPKSIYQDAN